MKQLISIFICGALGGFIAGASYLWQFDGNMSHNQKQNYFEAVTAIALGCSGAAVIGGILGRGRTLTTVEVLKEIAKDSRSQYLFTPEALAELGVFDE